MFGIVSSLVKFGARSALRALPREVRQPIRFVVSPVRTVRRVITPPLVRDAQRLVRQAANPVSAVVRSIENSLWQGAEGGQAMTVDNTLISETADLLTISMDETEVQIDYQCPFCSRPFVTTVPGFHELAGEFRQNLVRYYLHDSLSYLLSFWTSCPSCSKRFDDSIIYKYVPGPYVYRPIPLAEQVLFFSACQLAATVCVASFLLLLTESALLGILGFLGLLCAPLAIGFAGWQVIEHRFAELREKGNSSRVLRSIVVVATLLAPLGAIVATIFALMGLESEQTTPAIIAFVVQILVITPSSQTLACYPLENLPTTLRIRRSKTKSPSTASADTTSSESIKTSRIPCTFCGGKVLKHNEQRHAKCIGCNALHDVREHPDLRSTTTELEREVLNEARIERARLEQELIADRRALRAAIEHLGIEVQKVLNPADGDVSDDENIRLAFERAERGSASIRSRDEREAIRADALISRLRNEINSMREL